MKPPTIEQRVLALENAHASRQRIIRLLALACSLLIGALTLALAAAPTRAQGPPQTAISAQAFYLLDAAGKMRAGLAAQNGRTSLIFFDADDKPRASLILSDDGPTLRLDDAQGTKSLSLALDNAGPRLLMSSGTRGQVRLRASVLHGKGFLGMFDELGRSTWSAKP